MGSLSIWHWLIVLAIVILVFGTKKLRNAGGDLGSAVKNFKQSMKDGEEDAPKTPAQLAQEQQKRDSEAREHEHEQRSEEHTSELQALMRKSYGVFCLKKNNKNKQNKLKITTQKNK